MRASSNAVKPHSYADSFSADGRLGPRRLPIRIRATPMPVATIRNSKVGRYSASTRFLFRPPWPVVRTSCPALSYIWCPRGDSNPHDRSRYHLKVVRLPIPPPGQCLQQILTVDLQ